MWLEEALRVFTRLTAIEPLLPRSVRIGRNCALGLTWGTVSPNTELPYMYYTAVFSVFCRDQFYSDEQRTRLRVVEVCCPSVRTSLQGLDNLKALGAKAIDDLSEIAGKIADRAKSQAWEKETKQTLRSAKQYQR